MSDPDADAAAVTLAAGAEPFALVPVIAELLRTRYCVPGSVFLVEDVRSLAVTRNGRWRTNRLLLSDGELCVQALLDDKMHRFAAAGTVSAGCYVRLHAFELHRRPVPSTAAVDDAEGGAAERSVLFLVVRDLVTVGWNAWVRAALGKPETDAAGADRSDDCRHGREEMPTEERAPVGLVMPPDDASDDADESGHGRHGRDKRPAEEPSPQGRTVSSSDAFADADDADLEAAFDTLGALAFPDEPSRRHPVATSVQPIPLPKDWHDAQTPLKLTTLCAVPNLPFPQNWSVNVLVVVASLSPVEPSHLPPYRQRVARLADPSTSKRVHLTVFLDPESFTPTVGSAVLLTGVKNHRFDGGSLKKYESDGRRLRGGRWWFEDPWDMAWCDVRGIKEWWAQVEAAMTDDLAPP
ncbi:Cyclin-like F-box [Drechmeria coniospora]|uniref:Cyclin-like F-box n=1 Tax=Drechmeria coniospora TaxID=98403 RepID=A0A151GGZ4_DRECN|nr:Cyclin-like F-box [Drechmeria coniospora]KYK56301.1 Cyclin-like F-box [Drechmeria coniospora]